MAQDILEKPVKEALITMAAPASVGMLMTFLFQLVDTYFVGQLGTQELAAISFSYPIYILVVSLFMGIASGVSSSVGKALGERNTHKAQALVLISLILFMVFTMVLATIGYFTVTPVFSLLGATDTMLPFIADYMLILYLGMFALVGGLIGNAALMAKGIMVKSTAIMGIGGIVNLVLDYILIFGMGPIPGMALKGAAIATVISWFVILILMTGLLLKEGLLSFTAVESFKQSVADIKEILTISTPAVAAQILNPIAIAVITRVVSQSGENAVAAYGIATRVESLGLTGILALSVILTPMVAQNFGAKKKDRLDSVIVYSGKMTMYWGFGFYAVLLLFAGGIGGIFTDNPEVIAHTKDYLYILGISFPWFGLALITASFFNGVYQPKESLKLTLVKSLGFTIPFAIIGSLFNLYGVWIGLALAHLAGGLYAGRLLNQWMAKNDSSLVGERAVLAYWNDFKGLFLKLKR